ncbi:hypothetical protein A2533_02000 [Candidatus Falkowbacteria bacterium RIFOXYD2_FULL_35_9]|uniref:Transcription elongation factor GreA n=1 Tax=Candidatus Falkowbacteria bacterium RIFOXYC2_FULL_36_12 TaxID=1798002 RepID=A0A1F5SY50_9BACT|nr:MAG: hypothetical protein A2300_00860 [Candidatus Falkowbacteria bacterium RIFOXYB2_FULL_35_7]OGF31620.1 MAG: hypothetical protein A2478_03990 [Candidatus Falkowbacteria bacterium RIFOXYC2_FULL_36_12]OGF33916.1 MAG: hypothetical protein A2223_03000 [Candidatus Falkowbacteria bacterium RIFOXYA2_FULL_35_8]OGF46889.1 MAG: hypothetical protein A2533_02000 [Candidatus Falkowbacteria bacterium RIFOXYD2_FULL_35_9]
MQPKVITPDGLAKLKAELKELKEVKLPDIIDKIEKAKEMGDLSENAEYHDAKDQQGLMMARFSEIESLLKKTVVSEGSGSKDEIGLGSTFVVEDESGTRQQFTLVSFNEADPLENRISNESPLGDAFMGRRKNDNVEIEIPKGIVHYRIVELK